MGQFCKRRAKRHLRRLFNYLLQPQALIAYHRRTDIVHVHKNQAASSSVTFTGRWSEAAAASAL